MKSLFRSWQLSQCYCLLKEESNYVEVSSEVLQESREETMMSLIFQTCIQYMPTTFNRRFQHEVKCCKILPHLLMTNINKTDFLCARIRAINDRHFFSKILLFPKIQIQLKGQRFKNIMQFKPNHGWCWTASCKGNSRDSSVSGRGARPSA